MILILELLEPLSKYNTCLRISTFAHTQRKTSIESEPEDVIKWSEMFYFILHAVHKANSVIRPRRWQLLLNKPVHVANTFHKYYSGNIIEAQNECFVIH